MTTEREFLKLSTRKSRRIAEILRGKREADQHNMGESGEHVRTEESRHGGHRGLGESFLFLVLARQEIGLG